jgi:hypothetical protein
MAEKRFCHYPGAVVDIKVSLKDEVPDFHTLSLVGTVQ